MSIILVILLSCATHFQLFLAFHTMYIFYLYITLTVDDVILSTSSDWLIYLSCYPIGDVVVRTNQKSLTEEPIISLHLNGLFLNCEVELSWILHLFINSFWDCKVPYLFKISCSVQPIYSGHLSTNYFGNLFVYIMLYINQIFGISF